MPPQVKDRSNKLYYPIGEVAEMFNVNTSLIRYWEKEFDILQPRKNKKGDRLFTKRDLDHLQLIYHLVKERGFTLKGARKKLKENKRDTAQEAEVVKTLKKIREFLVQIRSEMDEKDPK